MLSFRTVGSVRYVIAGATVCCANASLPSFRSIRCNAMVLKNSPKPTVAVPPRLISSSTTRKSVRCNAVADKKSPAKSTSFPTEGKVIDCKAAVAWKAKEPLVVEDIQVDPPKAGEVRIKILYTSLCHTDVTYWLDKSELGMFPRIFGHEAAGVVESVGEGVAELKPGDHVLPVFTGECQNCAHCRSSKSNLCANNRIDVTRGTMLLDKTTRFQSRDGKRIYNFMGSTFSEYTVMEHQNIVKVGDDAPLDKICVLSCGVTTGFGSSWKYAKVEKGSCVAVFGLGTIGLAVAEGARVAGASRIIGVDLNPERFEQAKVFGVTDFINPKDHNKDVSEVIIEMTDGGVDYSFECVGNAKVVESALHCVHDGWGMAVVVGVEGKSTKVSIHPNQFLFGRTLTGVFFGGVKPRTELPQIVDMCTRKEIQLEEFITHELPFSKINDAFKLMLDGQGLRCVMHMGE